MAYLLEVPLAGGGRLIAETDAEDIGTDLVLANAEPGKVVARAKDTLERSLDELRPALSVVLDKLRAVAPAELTVEFGIKLGGAVGVIVAKGTTEVNFTVKMIWKKSESE